MAGSDDWQAIAAISGALSGIAAGSWRLMKHLQNRGRLHLDVVVRRQPDVKTSTEVGEVAVLVINCGQREVILREVRLTDIDGRDISLYAYHLPATIAPHALYEAVVRSSSDALCGIGRIVAVDGEHREHHLSRYRRWRVNRTLRGYVRKTAL